MTMSPTRHCAKCGHPLPSRVTVSGQVKNVSHRKYCLVCSPFGAHNTRKLHLEQREGKKCSHCGNARPEDFYASQHTVCKVCNKKYLVEKMRRNKRKIIEYMGGRCQVCGYDLFDCSLELHHLNAKDKSDTFSKVRSWKWERIEREIQSCVLLCSNCHQAVEAGYLSIVQSVLDLRA